MSVTVDCPGGAAIFTRTLNEQADRQLLSTHLFPYTIQNDSNLVLHCLKHISSKYNMHCKGFPMGQTF